VNLGLFSYTARYLLDWDAQWDPRPYGFHSTAGRSANDSV
jgi:hypothetical protein